MFWVWFKFTLHFIIPSAGTGPPRPIPRALLHFSATAHPARPHPTNHELPTGSRVSSPPAPQLPPWRPHRRRLVPRPACASRSSPILARRAGSSYRPQPQPRLVAAQSHPPATPLPAAATVRRDAETGLALLLVVLAAVLHLSLCLLPSDLSWSWWCWGNEEVGFCVLCSCHKW